MSLALDSSARQHNIQSLSTTLQKTLCETLFLGDNAERFLSVLGLRGNCDCMRWTRRFPPMDGLYWGRRWRWPKLEPELLRRHAGRLMSYPASEPRDAKDFDLFCGPFDPPRLPSSRQERMRT
jgi:hypothetical protein